MSRHGIFPRSARQRNQHVPLFARGPIRLAALWGAEMSGIYICCRRGFFAFSGCRELNGRFHHLHCEAPLITRNQTRTPAPNWRINNENGLCASCLLSNYPKARIES